MRPPATSRPTGAFTLIEVVVALAIFAFAGLVLAMSFVNVLNAQEASLRRDDRAADLRLVRSALRAEADRTRAEQWNEIALPDDRSARWKATVAATTVADLFDVTLEVEFTDTGGARAAFTETCRLLRPTWSQPGEREALRTEARKKLAQRTYQ